MLQAGTEIQGYPRSYSRRVRYLGESISKPFNCPATDDPGYSGSVAKVLSFATAISGALDHKGEGCRKNLSLNENILR